MSWEWVASLSTAVVGLAGIAATWLTARASRVDQRNMILVQHEQATTAALKETRRNAYAAFVTSLYNVISIGLFMGDSNITEAIKVGGELHRSLAEVGIVGSDAIIELAEHAVTEALEYLAAVFQEEKEASGVEEKKAAIDATIFILERLMADDLGIRTHPALEQALRNLGTLESGSQVIDYLRQWRQGTRAKQGGE
jgi:hypothetical protein